MARRASESRQAYQRAVQPTTQPDRDTSAERQSSPTSSDDLPTQVPRNKYTIALTDEDALLWDDVAMRLRRQLGRRVSKSELLRALVALTADDTTLLTQVADTIRRHDGTQ